MGERSTREGQRKRKRRRPPPPPFSGEGFGALAFPSRSGIGLFVCESSPHPSSLSPSPFGPLSPSLFVSLLPSLPPSLYFLLLCLYKKHAVSEGLAVCGVSLTAEPCGEGLGTGAVLGPHLGSRRDWREGTQRDGGRDGGRRIWPLHLSTL